MGRHVNTLRRTWTILALALVGCVATPLPEPPNLDRVSFVDNGGDLGVVGEAGAATPGSNVFLANLDDPEGMSVVTPADAEGAFNGTVAGMPGDVVQIQVRPADGPRLPAVDVDTGTGEPTIDTLGDCLSGDGPVDFGAARIDDVPIVRTVTLQNDCADPVSLTARVRAPGAFRIDAGAELSIPVGGAQTIELSYVATAIGPQDNHLLLQVASPVAERRSVLLEGEGSL